MGNDVINDTDLTSRDKQYLAKLFVKVYKEVDWSKVSKEINIEISWLNYAFQLTEGFTKDVGQWTTDFVAAKIKRLLNEPQVEYRPQLNSYLFRLASFLCPDKVTKLHTLNGVAYFQMRW